MKPEVYGRLYKPESYGVYCSITSKRNSTKFAQLGSIFSIPFNILIISKFQKKWNSFYEI